ncbi:MAG: ATP-binding protein, partial [Halanaeroarchaeum sp.]
QSVVAGRSPAVVHEDEASFSAIRETAEAGTVWIDEVTCRRRSGERYTAHQTVAPIVDASDAVAGYVGVQMDVTVERLRQQQLEVLYRVLRHNLRNDMTTLAGYAELLLEDAEDAATVDALEIIAEKAHSLATMSEKAGEVRHTLESVHAAGRSTLPLASLVADVRSTVDLGEASVTVSLADAAPLPVDQRLGSALEELLENARRHAERSAPSIRIDGDRIDGDVPRVVVRVADDGPGIPDEERAVLAAGHETPLQHGSGFGLWAVHWTVECLGGTIDIEGRDGGGTVVTLTIPLEAADAACPRLDRRSH